MPDGAVATTTLAVTTAASATAVDSTAAGKKGGGNNFAPPLPNALTHDSIEHGCIWWEQLTDVQKKIPASSLRANRSVLHYTR